MAQFINFDERQWLISVWTLLGVDEKLLLLKPVFRQYLFSFRVESAALDGAAFAFSQIPPALRFLP